MKSIRAFSSALSSSTKSLSRIGRSLSRGTSSPARTSPFGIALIGRRLPRWRKSPEPATNPTSRSGQFSDSPSEMKRLFLPFAPVALAVVLASCETSLKSAPPVTAAFIRAARPEGDARTLETGRKVFLNRCILCHALPDVTGYDPARIPRVVGWMSHRAHLSSEEQEALVKYLLTVRSQ